MNRLLIPHYGQSKEWGDSGMRLEAPLTGQKILLATIDESASHKQYLSWVNDPEVTRYLEVRHDPPSACEELRDYVANLNRSQNNLMLGIFIRSEGLYIGNIKLGPIDWRHSRAEIGLMIGEKRAWGCGFAAEAIALVARYAFGHLHLAKMTAGCYAGHVGSVKAFLKAGFRLEATLPAHLVFEGQRIDKQVFGLLASQGDA